MPRQPRGVSFLVFHQINRFCLAEKNKGIDLFQAPDTLRTVHQDAEVYRKSGIFENVYRSKGSSGRCLGEKLKTTGFSDCGVCGAAPERASLAIRRIYMTGSSLWTIRGMPWHCPGEFGGGTGTTRARNGDKESARDSNGNLNCAILCPNAGCRQLSWHRQGKIRCPLPAFVLGSSVYSCPSRVRL